MSSQRPKVAHTAFALSSYRRPTINFPHSTSTPSIVAALQRYATTTHPGPGTPYDHIDKKHEAKVANKEIESHPEEVSTHSSVRYVLGEEGVEDKESDVDMLAGVKSDLVGSSEA